MATSKQSQDLTMQFQQLRQQLQQVMMQNEQSNIQIMEIDKALTELKTAQDEAYKLSGTILIKSSKDKITKELSEEKESLEIRIKTFQKHENLLKEKLQKMQNELMQQYAKQETPKGKGSAE